MIRRIISLTAVFTFIVSSVLGPNLSYAQALALPQPGDMVGLTAAYAPVMMKGLKVHADNPLLFDFIIDPGKSGLKSADPAFKTESEKLIKYFLASLTIKEDDLWVNLSPYEKDRMIVDELGQTELGRDMLSQDYLLKQLTASLIYPEKELGKKFWDSVYAQARSKFGTSDIPIDTFNKVWIVADKADVYEKNGTAYVTDGHLKVMLESDYLAATKGTQDDSLSTDQKEAQELGKQIVREVILPELEKEVNQGQNFAPLRQMFYSMILASWYKMSIKDALLNQVYSNQAKTNGVKSDDPAVKEKIYSQYLEAYKKGVFNYIKEDVNAATQESVPHKYFSGGLRIDAAQIIQHVAAIPAGRLSPALIDVQAGMANAALANVAQAPAVSLTEDGIKSLLNGTKFSKAGTAQVRLVMSKMDGGARVTSSPTLRDVGLDASLILNPLNAFYKGRALANLKVGSSFVGNELTIMVSDAAMADRFTVRNERGESEEVSRSPYTGRLVNEYGHEVRPQERYGRLVDGDGSTIDPRDSRLRDTEYEGDYAMKTVRGRGETIDVPAVAPLAGTIREAGYRYDPEGFGYIAVDGDGANRAPRYGKSMDEAINKIEGFVQRHFGANPSAFQSNVIIPVIGIGGQTTCVVQADGLINKFPNRKLVVLDSLGTNYTQLEEDWLAALRADPNTKLLWVVGSKSGMTDETMINFQNTLRTMIYVWAKFRNGDAQGRAIAADLVSKLWNTENPQELAKQTLGALNLTAEQTAVLRIVFGNAIFITGVWDKVKQSGSLLDRMIKEGFLGQLYTAPEDQVVAIEMLGNLGGRFQGLSPNSFAINALLGLDVRAMLEAGREEATRERTQPDYVTQKLAETLVTDGVQHMVIGIPDNRFTRLAESLGQTVPESLGKGRQHGLSLGMQTYKSMGNRINQALRFNHDKKFYFLIDVEGQKPIALDPEIEANNVVYRYVMKSVSEGELAKVIQFVEDLTAHIGALYVSHVLTNAQKQGHGTDVRLDDSNDLRQIMQGPDKGEPRFGELTYLHKLFNDITPFRQPGVQMAKELVGKGGGMQLFNSANRTNAKGLPVRDQGERKTFYDQRNARVAHGPVIAQELSSLNDATVLTEAPVQDQVKAVIRYAHAQGKAANFTIYEDRNPDTEKLKQDLETLGADRVDFGPAEQHKSRQLAVQGANTAVEIIIQSVKTLERTNATEVPLVADGTAANYLHGLTPSEVRDLYATVYPNVFKSVGTETVTILAPDLTIDTNRTHLGLILGVALTQNRDLAMSIMSWKDVQGDIELWTSLARNISWSDINPDMSRDYDERYVKDGVPLKPEIVFLKTLIWAQMALDKAKKAGIKNRDVLIARDARKIEPEIVDAEIAALRYAGLNVVFIGDGPNCVTSYSWAVQSREWLMTIFNTASHVSQPDGVVDVTEFANFQDELQILLNSGLVKSVAPTKVQIQQNMADTKARLADLMPKAKADEILKILLPNMIVRGFKVTQLGVLGGNVLSLSTKEIKTTSFNMLKGLIADKDGIAKMKGVEGTLTRETVEEDAIRFNTSVGLEAANNESLFKLGQEIKQAADSKEVVQGVLDRLGQNKPLAGMKVAIEGFHTPSGSIAAGVFANLGAQVEGLNLDAQEISGLHDADPSIDKNLANLKARIIATHANFGIAFDLDGDRGAIIIPEWNPDGTIKEFHMLAPDNLLGLLMPYLLKDWGYSASGRKVGVIRDVLGTYGVNDAAKEQGVDMFQTDAGYVYLKALKEKMEPQGYVFPVYGERSGHTWLNVSGEIENPVAVAVLFATIMTKHKNPADENGVINFYRKMSIPYTQSPRFQPFYHPTLLKFLSENNTLGWKYTPGVNPPQAIVALGKNETVTRLSNEFTVGKTYGEYTVAEFNTYQDPVDEGGLYRFADIMFQRNGKFAGRVVVRASSNDPTFVMSYEAPMTGVSAEDAVHNRVMAAGLVMKFMINEGLGIFTRGQMREFMDYLAADKQEVQFNKSNLGPVEADYEEFTRAEAESAKVGDQAMSAVEHFTRAESHVYRAKQLADNKSGNQQAISVSIARNLRLAQDALKNVAHPDVQSLSGLLEPATFVQNWDQIQSSLSGIRQTLADEAMTVHQAYLNLSAHAQDPDMLEALLFVAQHPTGDVAWPAAKDQKKFGTAHFLMNVGGEPNEVLAQIVSAEVEQVGKTFRLRDGFMQRFMDERVRAQTERFLDNLPGTDQAMSQARERIGNAINKLQNVLIGIGLIGRNTRVAYAQGVIRENAPLAAAELDQVGNERATALSSRIKGMQTADWTQKNFNEIIAEVDGITADVDNAEAAPKRGGIELNANKMGLNVSRDGKGVQMKFDPAMVAQFQKGDFTGIVPVILNITPIANPSAMLGMAATEETSERT